MKNFYPEGLKFSETYFGVLQHRQIDKMLHANRHTGKPRNIKLAIAYMYEFITNWNNNMQTNVGLRQLVFLLRIGEIQAQKFVWRSHILDLLYSVHPGILRNSTLK